MAVPARRVRRQLQGDDRRHGVAMRRLTSLLGLGLLVAACASPAPPSTAAAAAPSAVAPGARAVDTSGPFTLVLELPTDTWAAGEPITGEARLQVADGDGLIYGSGGGPLAFGYLELTGHREMGPAMTSDCARHRLGVDTPITSPLRKAGGWSDDDPDAAFYRDFVTGPDIRLPSGDWLVTASADFLAGKDCSGAAVHLEAPIVLHIR
jgi:hypothetical protein